MNRRNFIKFLGCMPFLGFLKVKKETGPTTKEIREWFNTYEYDPTTTTATIDSFVFIDDSLAREFSKNLTNLAKQKESKLRKWT